MCIIFTFYVILQLCVIDGPIINMREVIDKCDTVCNNYLKPSQCIGCHTSPKAWSSETTFIKFIKAFVMTAHLISHKYIHTYVLHTYIYTYIRTYMHTYIHTYIHIHTYYQTCHFFGTVIRFCDLKFRKNPYQSVSLIRSSSKLA